MNKDGKRKREKKKKIKENVTRLHPIEFDLFPIALQIVVKDREKGEAELRAKKTLNCEKKKNYNFDIVAVSCAGLSSEK